MAPKHASSTRVKLRPWPQVGPASMRLFLILMPFLLTLHLALQRCPEAWAQDTNGKTSSSFSSSSLLTSSKGGTKSNEVNSGSKFREHIVHLQQKQKHQVIEQQQQQVVEQQQLQQQVVEQQQQKQQRVVVEQSIEGQQQLLGGTGGGSVAELQASSYGSIKGTPGVDFPAYTAIPNTKFSCAGAPFDPGMYADETTECQVYHLCYQGRRESFLCGVGTVFNQAIMSCDFWHSVDCSRSSQYYNLNADFGKSSPEPSGGGSSSSSSFFQQKILQQAQLPPLPPPTVQRSSQFEEQSSFSRGGATKGGLATSSLQVAANFGATKSATGVGAPAAASFRDYQQFSSQRKSAQPRPLSPSRRVSQLNSDQVQASQFSSAESSPMRSITATVKEPQRFQETAVEQVGSSLIVADESPGETKTQRTLGTSKSFVKSEMTASFASQKVKTKTNQQQQQQQQQVKVAREQAQRKTSVLGATKAQLNSANEESDVWKPYFKSKTKSTSIALSGSSKASKKGGRGTGAGQPKWPPPTDGEKSTTASSDSTSKPSEKPPGASTLAQPDQEPNFGGGSGSTVGSPTEAPETPKVPKSSPPPAAESAGTTEQTSTPSPAAIESDVDQALSSTTPAPDSPSPAEEQPAATSTTPAPTTTTTTTTTTTGEPASSPATEPSPPQTTTASPEASDSRPAGEPSTTTQSPTTSTSSTTAAPTTTAAAASENSPTSGETGEREANSEETKKKRGILTAGVEYVAEESARKLPKGKLAKVAARANASTVEYATERRVSS